MDIDELLEPDDSAYNPTLTKLYDAHDILADVYMELAIFSDASPQLARDALKAVLTLAQYLEGKS